MGPFDPCSRNRTPWPSSASSNYSEEIAEQIDFEVRQLVDEAHERALQILRDNIDTLHLIAKRLIEEETIDATEFAAIFGESDAHSQTTPPQSGTTSKDSSDSPPRIVPPSTAPLPA
jgi:cell division protease FtsH